MQQEKDNFLSALSRLKESTEIKHDFKVVTVGVGKVSSAVEVFNQLVSNCFDLVAVIGYAAGSKDFNVGDLVIPSNARYSDVHLPSTISIPELTKVYELEGSDCDILTADSFVTSKAVTKIMARLGLTKAIFDMEAAAICQVASDFSIPVLVAKLISDVPQSGNLFEFQVSMETLKDFMPIASYINML